jgi:CRISPR-associated protein Cas2
MKTRYIVTYDISDPKRLRQVYKTLRGYGRHLQLSVFRCDLADQERVVLGGMLSEIIDHAEDQVLFIRLGPAEGRADEAIDALGRALSEERRPLVL